MLGSRRNRYSFFTFECEESFGNGTSIHKSQVCIMKTQWLGWWMFFPNSDIGNYKILPMALAIFSNLNII